MSETTSVHDVVRSVGRACAQHGAGIADIHLVSLTVELKQEHSGLKKLKPQKGSASLKPMSNSLLHLRQVLQCPSSFFSVVKWSSCSWGIINSHQTFQLKNYYIPCGNSIPWKTNIVLEKYKELYFGDITRFVWRVSHVKWTFVQRKRKTWYYGQ